MPAKRSTGVTRALDPSEREVQKAILDLLAAEHIFAGRVNTSAGRRIHGVYVPAPHSFGAGTADILAFPRMSAAVFYCKPVLSVDSGYAIPLWIEVKSPCGRQSDAQRAFEEYVCQGGMYYLLARSVDDLVNWLKERRR